MHKYTHKHVIIVYKPLDQDKYKRAHTHTYIGDWLSVTSVMPLAVIPSSITRVVRIMLRVVRVMIGSRVMRIVFSRATATPHVLPVPVVM